MAMTMAERNVVEQWATYGWERLCDEMLDIFEEERKSGRAEERKSGRAEERKSGTDPWRR